MALLSTAESHSAAEGILPEGHPWQGFFTNLLNPKVFLFITAFLPQFADPVTGPIWLQLLILASISKTLGFIVSLALAGGASKIKAG